MIVIPAIVLKMLMQNIVEATHSLSDENGVAVHLGTIHEPALRQAAKHAIEGAIGKSAWPSDETIVFREGPRQQGIFRIER